MGKIGYTHKSGTGNNKKSKPSSRRLGVCNNPRGRRARKTPASPQKIASQEENVTPTSPQRTPTPASATTTSVIPQPSQTTLAPSPTVMISQGPVRRVRRVKDRIIVEFSYSQEEFIALNGALGGDINLTSHPSSAAASMLRFNNALVDFENADITTDTINAAAVVDVHAFDVAKDGGIRTNSAIRQAKSRASRSIINAIKSAGTLSQQGLALQLALSHPELRNVAKAVILDK